MHREERWELEADTRHVEILVSQKGLGDESKAMSTFGVRITDEDDGKECDAESRACHRSWTMRASYLSQDRCAAESQEHASAQALGGVLGAWPFTADKLTSKLWTSSQTATGPDVRRPGGRLRLRT